MRWITRIIVLVPIDLLHLACRAERVIKAADVVAVAADLKSCVSSAVLGHYLAITIAL